MLGRITRWIAALSLGVSLFPSPAVGQVGGWTGYVDASLISEIVAKDGEFYMASFGGLLIYNPADTTFEQYTNAIGLPSNYLTSLAFSSNGRLYVGTEDAGIGILDVAPGGFEVTPLNSTFNGLASDRITSVAAWGDTMVYGSRSGMGLIVEGFPGARFDQGDGVPSNVVADVFPDGDVVWIATSAGIAYLDRQGFITEKSDGLLLLDANVFARDDTALWVGTSQGVARFDEAADEWVPEGIPEAVFSIGFEPLTRKLWAGTRGRIYENNGAGWLEHGIFNIYVKYDLSNPQSEVRGLMPTADGAAYAGIAQENERRGGFLILYDGTSVRDIAVNGPPMNNLLRLSVDTDGSVWASSTQFGVGKLTPTGQWFNYNRANNDLNLSSRFFNLTCLADSKGSKWFCTLSTPGNPRPLDELRDGLDLDRGNDVWTHYNIGDGGGDGLQSLRNQYAKEDPAGNLWFLSDEDPDTPAQDWWGINMLGEDRAEWKNVTPTTTAGAMQSRNVTDVAFDAGGRVYVALKFFGVQTWFTGGYDQADLFDLTGDSWQVLGTVGGIFDSDAFINCLAVRSDGVLWIGTSVGLYKWNLGLVTEFHANRGFGVGLLSEQVLDVLLDPQENLWVATDLGLNRIARENDNQIQSFTTPVIWQTQLNLFFPPSVVSPLVDGRCNALAMDPVAPLLYVATRGGLSILDTRSLQSASSGLSRVYLYPNPIRGGRGDSGLKIGNLDSVVDVTVYNLEGELVHEARNISISGDVVWDLTTAAGFFASSGVYVVHIRGNSGTVVKTVSLIR